MDHRHGATHSKVGGDRPAPWVRTATPVSELARWWLERDPSKRRGTRQRDETIVRLHVVPEIGDRPIVEVEPLEVQRLVNRWTTRGSPRTVARQYAVLRAMFAYAVVCDWLDRSPCRGIRLPRPDPLGSRLLTPRDVATIAEAIDVRYRLMVWVGALLGLRWGEAAGLTAGAIDLDEGTVTVDRQLDRELRLSPPKSRSGARTLSIPSGLSELFRAHLHARGIETGKRDALVFTAPRGGPLAYPTWRIRFWIPAVGRAGLTGTGYHDLRRANATLLVAEQVDVKTAQARLGHADPWTTLALYARATSAADRVAAERLWQRFFTSPEAGTGSPRSSVVPQGMVAD